MTLSCETKGTCVSFSKREWCGVGQPEHYNVGEYNIDQAEAFVSQIKSCIEAAKSNKKVEDARTIENLALEITNQERELNIKKTRLARLRDERDGTPGRLIPA